ncbi:MAG: hypothetical protein ABI218_01985 [Caldimonas sp.]
MSTLYNDIVESLSEPSWDDIAAGLVCATFCVASITLFVAMFAGTV